MGFNVCFKCPRCSRLFWKAEGLREPSYVVPPHRLASGTRCQGSGYIANVIDRLAA